jgi:hypothetical protein
LIRRDGCPLVLNHNVWRDNGYSRLFNGDMAKGQGDELSQRSCKSCNCHSTVRVYQLFECF